MRIRLSLALASVLFGCGRAADRAPATEPQLDARLARANLTICATCHARGGTGAPLVGDEQAWRRRRAQGFEVLVAHTVNGWRGMPPLGTCGACSEADLRALVAYVARAAEAP
ncbi:MAG TPA: c-type cytochrome [Myxococcota bacterium]|nr:c-type cytochrome [Myxococcota bacterium]